MRQPSLIVEEVGVTFQPPCQKCGHRMRITHIFRVDDGEEVREFECQVCDATKSMTVKFR
jgi:hypothetical protein